MSSAQVKKTKVFTLRSTELKFLIYYILSQFLALGGIWIIYLTYRGLSLTQIAFIDIIFFGAIFLFEIPTGIIADKFGRKASLFLAGIIKAAGVLMFAFSTTFTGFMFSYFIWGVGITLSSGAEEAWLFDEIKRTQLEKGNEDFGDYYQKIMGYLMAGASISAAIAVTVGGLIAEIDLIIPIVITSAAFLISGFWALSIEEVLEENKEKTSKKTKEAFLRIFTIDVFPLTFLFIFISALVMSLVFWIQAYLDFESVDYGLIGIILGVSILLTSVSSSISSRVTSKTKYLTFVTLSLLIGLTFIIMSIMPIIGVVIGYYIIRMSNTVIQPYFSRLFNSKIETKNRATAISILSSMSTILILSYELISARIIEINGYNAYFIITGSLLLLIGLPFGIHLARKLRN